MQAKLGHRVLRRAGQNRGFACAAQLIAAQADWGDFILSHPYTIQMTIIWLSQVLCSQNHLYPLHICCQHCTRSAILLLTKVSAARGMIVPYCIGDACARPQGPDHRVRSFRMNQIIYLVGLVVIVVVILGFFGLR
ncbi:MAG: hypothetical protein Q8P60_10045 [Pseudorhodobacter sp.]|nr:hypothetical protein [Pseudorhodobacter sp.]